jgi:hypothetical protein
MKASFASIVLLVSCLALRADDGAAGLIDLGKTAPPPATADKVPGDPVEKAATRPAAPAAGAPAPVVATAVQVVADDFVAEMYHNGKPVPVASRTLQAEIYGAQVERVALTLRPGDWVVFNVVNNRLRWGGAYYFAAAAVDVDGLTVFSSQSGDGNWSACDDVAQAAKFIGERDAGRDRKPQAVKKEWDQGDKQIHKLCPDFTGEAIWGDPESKSTWIKFVVPNR